MTEDGEKRVCRNAPSPKKQFNKKTGVPFPSESGALLCEIADFGQKLHEISRIFLFSCTAIKYNVISRER